MELLTRKQGQLVYLQSPNFDDAICAHGFSTRLGGVSEGHLASLNLGVHRGDEPQKVMENYRLFGEAVGFLPQNTVFTKQRHTDIVRAVTKADCGTGLLREQTEVCDALITADEDVALVAFSADCTPVLLFDPVRRAVGAVHAGWRGTAQGIVKKTVEAMIAAYGCKAEDICAAIGPCIGQCHFQTDWDVPEAMLCSLGEDAKAAIEKKGEKYYVDLKLLNRLWLERAGVNKIDIAAECTACQPNVFWSHRTVGDQRGSLAAVIMLRAGRTE